MTGRQILLGYALFLALVMLIGALAAISNLGGMEP